jgi:hypothetical protein
MKKGFFILAILTLIFNTSCSTLNIKVTGKTDKVKSFKSLAVLNVYISPPASPTFPLIDAGIYNGNYNDIYGEISIFHEQNTDKVVKYLGDQFEKYSKNKVLYGEDLYSILTTDSLKKHNIKTHSLLLDNDDFPKIPLPKYAANFFDFSKGSYAGYSFEPEKLKQLKPELKKIIDMLSVDGLIVAYLSVSTIDVGMFGISGDRVLRCKILIFDNEGNNICSGTLSSEKISGKADDMWNYKKVFEEYYQVTDLFLRKLYLNEEPKE